MSKLTKEQIVGELIAEDQITIEEAVTLLTENDECLAFDYTITTT